MKTSASISEILAQLRQQAEGKPVLQSLIPAYEALWHLEETTSALPLPLELTPAEAIALLDQGIPLLQREGILLAAPEMAVVWQQVCDVAIQYLANQKALLQQLRDWPHTQHEKWLATMGQYFRDGKLTMEEQQEKDLLTFVLVHTWRPFLLRWGTALAALVDNGHWGRARCPLCGGQPDIAYLGKKSGERHLLCARCDTDWQFQRLGCTFCNNLDKASYGYYPGENNAYRLYVCNQCQRYLKTLDMRDVMGERLLMVERVATIGMDISALQAGYHGS